jgi:hypothetical protein
MTRISVGRNLAELTIKINRVSNNRYSAIWQRNSITILKAIGATPYDATLELLCGIINDDEYRKVWDEKEEEKEMGENNIHHKDETRSAELSEEELKRLAELLGFDPHAFRRDPWGFAPWAVIAERCREVLRETFKNCKDMRHKAKIIKKWEDTLSYHFADSFLATPTEVIRAFLIFMEEE